MEATHPALVPAATAVAWSVHPLREAPRRRSLMLLGLILGFAIVAGVSFGDPVFGLVAVTVLTGAMNGYLLPTHYVVDADGVGVRRWVWRRRPWTAVRRVDHHGDGLFLSPFVRPSHLDSFRGLFLPFSGPVDAAALTSLVESRVAP